MASDVDLAKGLGDITVEFHHVNIIVMPSKSDSKSSFKVPKCVTQIAEKALKVCLFQSNIPFSFGN